MTTLKHLRQVNTREEEDNVGIINNWAEMRAGFYNQRSKVLEYSAKRREGEKQIEIILN